MFDPCSDGLNRGIETLNLAVRPVVLHAGIGGDSRREQAFRPSSCGDCRARAGASGDLLRDVRGIGPARGQALAVAVTAPSAVGEATRAHPPACRPRRRRVTRTPRQRATVLRKRFGVSRRAQLVQQIRRALDVGEEELDPPRGRSRRTGG
jgi:hypothetical protein